MASGGKTEADLDLSTFSKGLRRCANFIPGLHIWISLAPAEGPLRCAPGHRKIPAIGVLISQLPTPAAHPAMRAVLVRSLLPSLMLAALIGGGMAPAQGSLHQRLASPAAGDLPFGGQDIAYGNDPLQRLSFWGPATKTGRPVPLILFVHGGGWKRGDRATATGC